MNIGIIGAGSIGGTAARLFVKAGHNVAISNSRNGDGLRQLISELGPQARAATIAEATHFGDVVLVAIPFGKIGLLPPAAFEDKVVIDAGNYYPQRDGKIADLDNDLTTSSELLAEHLKGARIIKGFNTIWSEHLATQGDTNRRFEDRRAIFIAGDDTQAKQLVARLIDELGFAAVDTGELGPGGRRQQPGSAVYNKNLSPKEVSEFLLAT
jgi:8-hydroxy-5-deazaflavin:NADPH oxidoreductase